MGRKYNRDTNTKEKIYLASASLATNGREDSTWPPRDISLKYKYKRNTNTMGENM